VANSIIIFGEPNLGLEIANWIAETSTDETIEIVVATSGQQDTSVFAKLNKRITNLGEVDKSKSAAIAQKYANTNNFLITCYWPWILPEQSFEDFGGNTLNFHPALLPKDKGWYPHVHQIRNNSVSGVTLHQLTKEADAGNIWVQNKVILPFPITAGEARDLLLQEIICTFKQNWWEIYGKNVIPVAQSGPGNYLKKNAVDALNSINLNEKLTFEEFIRILASRNIGNRSFFSIEGTHGRKYVHISFSDEGTV
jgi:methionyl-tRNA formyltransferase